MGERYINFNGIKESFSMTIPIVWGDKSAYNSNARQFVGGETAR